MKKYLYKIIFLFLFFITYNCKGQDVKTLLIEENVFHLELSGLNSASDEMHKIVKKLVNDDWNLLIVEESIVDNKNISVWKFEKRKVINKKKED